MHAVCFDCRSGHTSNVGTRKQRGCVQVCEEWLQASRWTGPSGVRCVQTPQQHDSSAGTQAQPREIADRPGDEHCMACNTPVAHDIYSCCAMLSAI